MAPHRDRSAAGRTHRHRLVPCLVFAALLAGCAADDTEDLSAAQQSSEELRTLDAPQQGRHPVFTESDQTYAPDDDPPAPTDTASADTSTGVRQTNGIHYHGGHVMGAGYVNVYLIFYGGWHTNGHSVSIIEDFVRHLGDSPYWNINTTYDDQYGHHVGSTVKLAGTAYDHYSRGHSLNAGAIEDVVSATLSNGAFPEDTHGVYMVLVTDDVAQGADYCASNNRGYCGWHTYGRIQNSAIKFAFIGNPNRCPSTCASERSTPNDFTADTMVNILAHELEESASDPMINAWYTEDSHHNVVENADRCAWTFGTTYTANGARANMQIGSRHYLIQRNWLNANGGYCTRHR